MRIIFLGTPIFAVKCLERLIHSNHEVVAVVTQPDKPTERGNKIEFSDNIIEIGDYCFLNCTALRSVDLPNKLQKTKPSARFVHYSFIFGK